MKKIFSIVALCALTLCGSLSVLSCGSDDENGVVDNPAKTSYTANLTIYPEVSADFSKFCTINIKYDIEAADKKTVSESIALSEPVSVKNIVCPCTITIFRSYAAKDALQSIGEDGVYTISYGPVYDVKTKDSGRNFGVTADIQMNGAGVKRVVERLSAERKDTTVIFVSEDGHIVEK